MAGIGSACTLISFALDWLDGGGVVSIAAVQFRVAGLAFFAGATFMVLGSRFGKAEVVRRLVDGLELEGHEQVLDIGCGRGMVLLEVARRLTLGVGKAVGIDVFDRLAQSGNRIERTFENASRAGVEDRIDVRMGDARKLPVDDASVDAVACSLVFQRIRDPARAIRELTRVLRPGARIAFLNLFWVAGRCHRLLEVEGLEEVCSSGLHFRIFPPVRITTARMPGARRT